MIRHPNQRIEMICEAQDGRERTSRILELPGRSVLQVEQRVQRVFNGYNIVGGYHNAWYGNCHVCKSA